MYKLIILENEPLLMRALVRALSKLDVELLQANDQESAALLLEAHPDVALLVTDYYLNDGETSEGLLRKVQQQHRACRRVLMSGQDARALELDRGLYHLFIPKPFSILEFRELLNSQLKLYRPGGVADASSACVM